MRRTLMLSMAWAGLSWAGLATPALAEQNSNSKALGDPYYLYAAKTYGDHAADHVHILRQFISTGGPLSVDWLRQHVEAVRSHADATQQAYAQFDRGNHHRSGRSRAALRDRRSILPSPCNLQPARRGV